MSDFFFLHRRPSDATEVRRGRVHLRPVVAEASAVRQAPPKVPLPRWAALVGMPLAIGLFRGKKSTNY